MPLVNWNPSFSVKIVEIDLQHQKLFNMINTLHEAMSTGKSQEVLGKIFDDLAAYTRTHFAYEENLMQSKNYPGYPVHKRQHEDLIQQVANLQAKYKAGELSVSIETRDFLRDWLVNHINGTDQKYVPFLTERGVR